MQKDTIIGAVLALAGLLLVLSAADIRRVMPIGLSPATFPIMLSVLLVALGALLALNAMLRRPADQPSTSDAPARPSLEPLLGLGVYLLVSLLVTIAFKPLGFIVSGALVIGMLGLRTGANLRPLILVAVGAPLIAHFGFQMLFGVPLPHGILAGLLP